MNGIKAKTKTQFTQKSINHIMSIGNVKSQALSSSSSSQARVFPISNGNARTVSIVNDKPHTTTILGNQA